MLQASQRASANAQFAADEARRVSRQQGVVESANYHSALTSHNIASIDYEQYVNQQNRMAASAAITDRWTQRTIDSYAANPSYSPSTSLLSGVDVEANIAWAEAQRAGYRTNLGLEANTPMGGWLDTAWGAGTQLVDMTSQFLQGTAQLITQGPVGVYMNGGFETYSFLDKPTTLMEASGRFMGDVLSYVVAPEAALFSGTKAIKALSIQRARVEANINASRLARENSGFSVLSHKEKALNIELRAQNGNLGNSDVRSWYNETVAPVSKLNEQWLRHGFSAEERATLAHGIRHEARIKARSFMADPVEVEMLRARDLQKYQNPHGPTLEHLVNKNLKAGMAGDDIFEAIINSSNRTSKEYNKRFGIK